MRLLGPTRHPRLNEAAALVYLLAGFGFMLCLVSYSPADPSWNTATGLSKPRNLIGLVGSHVSDFLFQVFGLGAYVLPILLAMVAWKWFRSVPIQAPWARLAGAAMLVGGGCTALALGPDFRPLGGGIGAGGLLGLLFADVLTTALNPTGAVLATAVLLVISLYLISTFTIAGFASSMAAPVAVIGAIPAWWRARAEAKRARAEKRQAEKSATRKAPQERGGTPAAAEPEAAQPFYEGPRLTEPTNFRASSPAQEWQVEPASGDHGEQESIEDASPEEQTTRLSPEPAPLPQPAASPADPVQERDWTSEPEADIPIRTLEDLAPAPRPAPSPPPPAADLPPWDTEPTPAPAVRPRVASPRPASYQLPPTDLLKEAPARGAFDRDELKEVAARIKGKFEEFNVHGQVVQINPGPVVTTYEYKPEAGVKLSRITTLTEDLCLGLQAESVLIERIPGKPTVGIEVPNSRSEVIALRQILESEEFLSAASHLTIAMGKDINGRIKVTTLESMPHLLIAGSTGSGKSVMLNSMIMSILYKSTPDQVRMIMVDPKRVELGMYEGIPHLLTPVITDPKKATNALRNAVLEMERRLKLLASQGVRNIDQFNRKVAAMPGAPATFRLDGEPEEELKPLPYVLIIIDELADLMMLERAGVEECVTRLAQMARAVGMHVVLATQRPSVDVITGLIKANFPARISFRVATRVDSRTILDSMGAEHLLGRGDMLFLPPGSSRLVRVHGAYVSESETNGVVEHWKRQATPEYDEAFLKAPPSDGDDERGDGEEGSEDPEYQNAVRIVLEMGKASTSILQRRLRLGYGRAARILDMMQRDGIIGPPDGSRPREVLKRPDWLDEIG